MFGESSSQPLVFTIVSILPSTQPRRGTTGDVELRTEPRTLPLSDFMSFREYSGLLSLAAAEFQGDCANLLV